jgi:hypothetical protein
MLTAIYQNNLKRDQLEFLGDKEWSKIISAAVAFATHVCMSYENYVSLEFANEYKL